jgi:hypothetical protein
MGQPDGYGTPRGPNDPATLLDFMEPHRTGFATDFGIRMLPQLMNHAPAAQTVAATKTAFLGNLVILIDNRDC